MAIIKASPAVPSVELGCSLGEWHVTITERKGNAYSRVFAIEADALCFADGQLTTLGLSSTTRI
jgi:hypothetical protein